MSLRGRAPYVLAAGLFAASVVFSIPAAVAVTADAGSGQPIVSPWPSGARMAENAESGAKTDAATDAFNSAKELGTVEAWDAFLTNYPNGFHADLARAYLKKLIDQAPPATPAARAATGTAQELSCAEQSKLRSSSSSVPTKVTFVNNSGMYRSIQWIDYNGGVKDFGGLNPGAKVSFDTFVTHPWMVATGPGDCLQIFMPDATPTTIELIRLAADDAKKAREETDRSDDKPVKKKVRDESDSKPKKKTLVCAQNYKLRNGQCVIVQNCGANATRSPEGDCYCNKNYTMRNGTCFWKTDKNGYEISPEKKTGCSTWKAQCAKGNGNACGKYEANCQVN